MAVFDVRILLSVTTGRLLTHGRGRNDNGIADMYHLLRHMTGEFPFTHQLGRFAEECRPYLCDWFPELRMADESLGSLDDLLAACNNPDEAVEKWLQQLLSCFPEIHATYDVPAIPAAAHVRTDAFLELAEMLL